MTPTLIGRIQSRIILILLVGIPWTLLASPFLPGIPDGVPTSEVYKITFRALAIVIVVGVVIWEPIYHFLQQFRWEKDWPTLFALLVVIPEAATTKFVLNRLVDGTPPLSSFLWHFIPLWIFVWAMAIGPIKVFLIRYRFGGGRFI